MKNVDPMKIGFIRMSALSWAATHVPKVTVAIQSLLKAGFLQCRATGVLFMVGSLQPVTKAVQSPSFRKFIPKTCRRIGFRSGDFIA